MSDYINRYIEKTVSDDLKQKMVFIGGPRQSGKTTLAKQLCRSAGFDPNKRYLNWDALKDRELIMREQFPSGSGMLILDEVHKYSRWRQTVKGLYDKRGDELNILVTGSARLDYYRRGGDSLQGRYHFYRLLPFSLKELNDCTSKTLHDLLIYGGFPEPFLSQSEKETRRWSREYRTRIIREDLADLENVKDLSLIEQMALRLPELVGSPLSINGLREDLNVSHPAASRWVQILENLYMIFRIYPFGAPKIRAVKKEAKHYHLDWTVINDPGARFENLVACHLQKWVYFLQDTEGRDTELRFFRDIDRREVDFVLMENNLPTHFIECKRAMDKQPSRALKYLKIRFPDVHAAQVSLANGPDVITKENIRMCPAHVFLSELI